MYIKSLNKQMLNEFFEGSKFKVVWAEPYFYKFKRTRFDSVEEYVHNDFDFKMNCPLGGAMRALLCSEDGKMYVVNFYDYSADVLNSCQCDEIKKIYLKGMANNFGAQYVKDCKANNENIDSLRQKFVERYGKRSMFNSDIIIKIPLERKPNFEWAEGVKATDVVLAGAQFSQNINQLSRKLDMQLFVKDFIK